MNLKTLSLMLGLALALTISGITSNAFAQETKSYNVPKEPFEIDPKDYADIKEQFNEAATILKRTVYRARRLRGTKLRSKLLSGIEDALKASKYRQELTLFRFALKRALQLDEVFTENSREESVYGLSAQRVLFPLINSALKLYKESDLPRLKTTLIAPPDWILFAYTQIPVLVNISVAAPTNEAERKVVIRAIGWTLRSLNSLINRRKLGKEITKLGSLFEELKENPRFLVHARSGLSKVGIRLEEKRKAEELAEKKKKNPYYQEYRDEPKKAPDGSFPSSESKKFSQKPKYPKLWFNSTLPLVPLRLGEPTDKFYKGDGYRDGYEWRHFTWSLGSGLGTLDNKTMSKLTARYHGLFNSGIQGSDTGKYTNFLSGFMQSDGKASVHFRSGRPLYNVKLQANGTVMVPILGVWAAVERNDYDDLLKETRAAIGWGPTVAVRIGSLDYILVRPKVAAEFNSKFSDAEKDGVLTWGLGLTIKKSRFLLNVDYIKAHDNETKRVDNPEYDPDSPFSSGPKTIEVPNSVTRKEISGSLAIPLGLIFPNDTIRVEGKQIDFTFDDPSMKRIKVQEVGAVYELQF